ncbi:centrosomal protein of 164 kDa isoform X2 [Octopus bimaculoides]|uniref:centrosomal protein of 164 kDa isoform X2 n=1 Tax=Octopus bimaculoides TaxID=37653 RepID=UPI00071E4C17|nr:centrosomal protein of 164 kDa isoform X2 [Octopus bimaculoides]|eukprot:XP_014778138.1 PREDICTED: centrosomal protein of 164 kDa-like isoform X2 [Octopus bimaculoides]
MSTQNQIILEETFDENYQPTEDEILEYARTIDIDPETEPHLMWIAQEGILAHLPDDWRVCEDLTSGHIYYFNLMNGTSTWDHPCDDYYKKMAEGEREKNIINNNIPAGKKEKDLIIMNKEKIEHNDSRLEAPKANFSPGLPSVHKTNKPLSNLAPLKASGNVLASLQASTGQNVKSSLNLTGTSSKTGSVGVSNSRHFTSSMSIPVYSTEFEDEVEQGKEKKKQINIQGDSESESESEDYGKDVDFGIDKGLSEKIMDIENLDFVFRDLLEKDFDGTLSLKSTARDESGEKVSPSFLDVAGGENKRIQEILTPSPTPTPTSPSLGAAVAAKIPVVVVSTATANRLSSEESSKMSLPEEMKKTTEECSETDLESKKQEIAQKHEKSLKELREKYEKELEKAKEEMRENKETKVKELKAIFLKEELEEIEKIEQEKEDRIKSVQQELDDQLSKLKSENQKIYEKEKEKIMQTLNQKELMQSLDSQESLHEDNSMMESEKIKMSKIQQNAVEHLNRELEDVLKQRRQSLKEKHQAETKEIEAKHENLLEKLKEDFKEKEKQERKNFAEKLGAKQKEMREEMQQKMASLKKELTAEREKMEKQSALENASLREKLVNLQQQREELEQSTEELARKEKDFEEKRAKFLKNHKVFFEEFKKADANRSLPSENGSNSKIANQEKEKFSPSPSSLRLGSTNLVNGNDSFFNGLGNIEDVHIDDCAEGTFGSQPMPRALSSFKENQEGSSLGSKPNTPVENAQKSPRIKITNTHLPKSDISLADEKVALSSVIFEELRVNLENINDKFKQLQSYIHPEQQIRSTWPKRVTRIGDNKETPYLKYANSSRPVTFDPALDLELNTDIDNVVDDDDDDDNGLDDTLESSSEDDSYNNLIKLLKSNQNAPAESGIIPETSQNNYVNVKSKAAYMDKSTKAGDSLDNQYLCHLIGDLCAVIEETPVTPQVTAIKQSDWTNPISHANAILQSRRSEVKQNKLRLSPKISRTQQLSWQHYSSNMPKSYFEVSKATGSNYSAQYVPAKDLLLELRRPTRNGGTISVSDWLTEQRSHMQPVKPDQVPFTNITKFYTVDIPDQNYLNIGSSNHHGNNSFFNNNIGDNNISGNNIVSNNMNSIFEPLTLATPKPTALATPKPLTLSTPKLTSEAPKLKLDANNQISIEKPLPFTLPC